MKLVLIGLVFSAFVASTLAMPSFDDENKVERDTFKNAFLQYWLKTMINGEYHFNVTACLDPGYQSVYIVEQIHNNNIIIMLL